MAFDQFYDHLLIETLRTNSKTIAEVCSIAKTIRSTHGAGPSKEAIDYFEKHQGKDVQVKGGIYEGVIHRLNTSSNGFYPGNRYPICILITAAANPIWERYVGTIIEYDIDQLVLLEE